MPPTELTSSFIWKLLEAETRAEVSATEQDWGTNVLGALLAGHETTRWSSVALLLHVMQHPEVVQKLRAEMQAAQEVWLEGLPKRADLNLGT